MTGGGGNAGTGATSSGGTGSGATWVCSEENGICYCSTFYEEGAPACVNSYACCVTWPSTPGYADCHCSDMTELQCADWLANPDFPGIRRSSTCPPQ